MAKPSCKVYSDVVSVLSNQDRRESEFLGLDLTKPASTWFDRVALRLGKIFRSKNSPLNENDMSVLTETVEMLKQFKDFYNSLEINLLEVSDKLKTIQKLKINNK